MFRFILLLAVLTAFPPLSTDMYLPAIPYLQKVWDKPLAVINLTLVFFFITYCFFLLIYGPLSDRYGRKPPLVAGLLIFIAGSLLCALSTGVEILIAARIIQAAGAASASAISMAIAKDRLKARQREKVLGYVSVIMAFAPMAAPMIGSLILAWFSWHFIFTAQAVIGAAALIGVLYTPESNPAPKGVPAIMLVKNYGEILKNARFISIVACTSVVGIPFFGFIASSASIYITDYRLSEQVFSLFFGANALCFMAGAMTCTRLGSRLGSVMMLTIGYAGMTAGGLLMLSGALSGPWALGVPMGVISFFLGLGRPPAHNLALEQVTRNAGAASSLMVFIYFLIGAIGMALASLEWSDKVGYLALMSVITGGIASLLWYIVKTRIYLPQRTDEAKSH